MIIRKNKIFIIDLYVYPLFYHVNLIGHALKYIYIVF